MELAMVLVRDSDATLGSYMRDMRHESGARSWFGCYMRDMRVFRMLLEC